MTRFAVLSVLACVTLSVACGGRSVDLQRAGSGGASGAGSADQPVTTVLNDGIAQFWVDDTRLYWQTDTFAVRGCLQLDCAHTTVTYGTSAQENSVAVGGNDIFWLPENSQQSVIFSCPKPGCAGTPRTVVRDPNGIYSTLAADGDYFYWSSPFDIYRCPKAGCGATPETVAANQTGHLSFQGDNVYWQALVLAGSAGAGASEAGAMTESSPTILWAPKDGSAPAQQLRLGESAGPNSDGILFSYALDSKRFYWLDTSGTVLACPLQGCTSEAPVKLADLGPEADDLRVDDTGLYWIEWSDQTTCGDGRTVDGSLHYCAFADCGSKSSTVLATEYVNDYALSGPYVYFTERTENGCFPQNIERIARPTR